MLLPALVVMTSLAAQPPRGAAEDVAIPSERSAWWSLRPLREPTPPELDDPPAGWPRNAIDLFVLRRLREAGLEPSGEASPRALARRLHFDLVGLPPAPAVIDVFAADPSDLAHEALVDELLASPHHGERWARHWLDVARYGESNGFEYNEARRDAWPYRDWVIEALNADLPYDEFARLQVAGDVLEGGARGAAAVGFLVAGVHNTVLGASDLMQRQARQDELEEIVATVSQTFLGLTAHCARCHDHKLDPIATEDYYQLAAALDGVQHGSRDVVVEGGGKLRVHTVIPRQPAPMRVHLRGNAATLGDEVPPGAISSIVGLSGDLGLDSRASDTQRRRRLAEWIAHDDNPLFARTIVNRVWHYHFGTGLVATPSDLGAGGGRPSHPDLLEWLASWFRDRDYRLKSLHRLIVTSATYRQSAAARPEGLAKDASGRLLWRYPPRRVEAEVLRDAMLTVAGALDTRQGGPGYEDVREEHFNAGRYYHPLDVEGKVFRRRTIYRFSPRGGRSALLDTFDCPDPSTTAPRRAVTTTPLQALSLLNNRLVWRLAESFAERVSREAGEGARDQARRAFRLALGRQPSSAESERALTVLQRHGLPTLCRALFNSSDFILIE